MANTLAFATLLSGVFLDEKKKKGWYGALLFAAGTIIFQVAYARSDRELFYVASLFFAAGFIGLIIVRALTDLFRARRVTTETIAASLCVYLLFGVGWSIAYAFADWMDPHSFTVAGSASDSESLMQFGTHNSSLSLYYSFVTLSTLGYGDVSPAAPLARMLAASEALTGQLYIAVLVARLVALQIVHGDTSE
jgi:hypothetical protein